MNEYERARLMKVVRAWSTNAERTDDECLAFCLGVLAVIDVLDGGGTPETDAIAFDVNVILNARRGS